MHKPYESLVHREADFKVRYRFFRPDEGGRKSIPGQGYRSDFWYVHPEPDGSTVFMIWPEFEEIDGSIIMDTKKPVPESGVARMFIIDENRIGYHKKGIKVGTKGFFMEGLRKVAECEVITAMNQP